MAKKNNDASEKPLRKPPAKQAESTPADAKKTTSSSSGAKPSAPLIDTSLAANAAAAMIANKVSGGAGGAGSSGGSGGAPKKESAAFKQLKAGLNKPAAGALGGAFGIAGQSKKSHLPHGGGKQVGHN